MRPFIEKLPLSEHTSFVARTHTTPNFEVSWHQHIEYELILFLEGEGMSFVGNGISSFVKGDIFFLGSNLPHTFQKARPEMVVSALVVHFTEDFWGEKLLQLPEAQAVRKLFNQSAAGFKITGELRNVLAPYILSLQEKTGFYSIINLCNCLALLAENMEHETLSTEVYQKLNEKDRDRINAIYQYALSHFKDPIELSSVAGIAGMTKPAFCNYFRKRTRKTYVEFVNEIRVGHAAQMLLDGDEQISTISYESGFNSLAHFNRQFLRLKKITPSAFRQKVSTR